MMGAAGAGSAPNRRVSGIIACSSGRPMAALAAWPSSARRESGSLVMSPSGSVLLERIARDDGLEHGADVVAVRRRGGDDAVDRRLVVRPEPARAGKGEQLPGEGAHEGRGPLD